MKHSMKKKLNILETEFSAFIQGLIASRPDSFVIITK